MIVKMKDICTKIGSGATPRGGKDAYNDEGISLIRSQNILDFSFSHDGLTYINEEQARKLNGVTVEVDDVLLNITGDSVARVCIVDNDILPARVNQHVCILRGDKDKVLSSFILYFLQMKKQELLQMASGGATRNALTKGMIEELEIDLPTIEDQKKIVSTLDSIQEKLKTNNKINRNLSEQAQALYKSWFVDLNPFEGERPADWQDGTVDDLASEVVCGKTPSTKKEEYYGNDIPFVTIPDMHGCVYTIHTERSLSELGAESQSKKTLPKNSICVSCIGTAGLVTLLPVPSQTNQQINSIIPKDNYSPYYIYLLMSTMRETINKLGQAGSTIVNLNKTQFGKIEVLIPSIKTMSDFDEIVEPVFSAILSNQIENEKLANLRDSLLPKLMSGEIDVSDLEI